MNKRKECSLLIEMKNNKIDSIFLFISLIYEWNESVCVFRITTIFITELLDEDLLFDSKFEKVHYCSEESGNIGHY